MGETNCIIFNKGMRAVLYFLHIYLKTETKIALQLKINVEIELIIRFFSVFFYYPFLIDVV